LNGAVSSPDSAAPPSSSPDAEARSPLFGSPLATVPLDAADAVARAEALQATRQAVVVGLDSAGALPDVDLAPFDVLLTSCRDPPRPWVGPGDRGLEGRLEHIAAQAAAAPAAAALLCSVLRAGETLPFEAALELESLAYSTLLAGAEFRRWRAATSAALAPAGDGPSVLYAREHRTVTLTLNRPERRNSTTAELRDGLCEALTAVLDDPSAPDVVLTGAGKCFSVGGELSEFGTADDLARAHFIRTLRSPARLLHRLGERATVRFHGACIGAGVEIGAAAAHRTAAPNAFFQLPELSMGLIPGAGGTATLPRAIGRHRTAWLGLSGARLSAAAALTWGLVQEVAPA
jgi:enoyl-CoA hydratase/carnithine racemase